MVPCLTSPKLHLASCKFPITGKNNRFPFLDILGYLKNTHRNPKFGRVRHFSPNQGTWLGIPWSGLVSLCQMWDFYGYSLNTVKYPKMGICYFFLCIFPYSKKSNFHWLQLYEFSVSIHKGTRTGRNQI